MGSELAVRTNNPVELGRVLAQSGYFQDAREAAQAAVKVMAGQELGLGPIASMTGIHIVKGKVTLSANMIAGQIKRSERYDFRAAFEGETACEVTFFENGEEVGRSRFSMDDAERAGLIGPGPWVQHPRNMLFARAISNGAKWYCPDVFAGPTGPIYTPDELGLEVDGETGEVMEAPAPPAPPVPPAATPKPMTPYEEILATGRADGLSKDAVRKILKEAGITRPRDLEDEAVFRVALDAVTGFIGADDKGGLPVTDETLRSPAEPEVVEGGVVEAAADAAWKDSKAKAGAKK